MSNYDPSASTTSLLGRAAQSADHAIQATQSAANHALDGLADSVGGMQASAESLSQRGHDAWSQGVRQVRDGTRQATESTRHYIQAEPVKAMLMAAGAGAALMALVSLLARSRSGH